jgi:pyruvate,water dikinase
MMKAALLFLACTLAASLAIAGAKVMNAGEAVGQLVFLSVDDVKKETLKYKSLSPLSIPVFAELPLDMSVVAGAITLKQQNLLSHVQLKSRARHTPNLDISTLEGGMTHALFKGFKDGSWVRLVLANDQSVRIEASTEQKATEFYARKKTAEIRLRSDLSVRTIYRSSDLTSADFIRVGSKAANYGELARTLNTSSRTIVRPGYGIPFAYYQDFVDSNPRIKAAIESVLKDPLIKRVEKVAYREGKLKALRDLMMADDAEVSEDLLNELYNLFEQERFVTANANLPRNMKLRSSTNSEDLPNFNGAGLYESESYKPTKKGVELSKEEKFESLRFALRTVWASVWNLRAYDERAFFHIPHAEVKMGIQVNPSFAGEEADGVVVTKNIANDARFPGAGVYIEVQRGEKHAVANPKPGVKPQRILVLYDENAPLNVRSYRIHVLQNSNIADDGETILPQDNLAPVLANSEVQDLTLQVLKAHERLQTLLDQNNARFSLDLEFKLDANETGSRQVYLKQARPYID